MRVLLYETNLELFTLEKEIDFLNDYIELMRIRVNKTWKLILNIQNKYRK